jgi:alkylated DNA repair dioxygenase AlkB
VIDSLESVVEKKLTELTSPTDKIVESIQKQLSNLTNEILELKGRPSEPPTHPPLNQPTPRLGPPTMIPQVKTHKIEDIKLKHATKHIEKITEDYITVEEELSLMNFLETEEFTNEGERSVVQYGEYYKYMGSRSKPKEMPEPIKKILDRLNTEYGSAPQETRYHYSLNSCLINRYDTKASTLPEHADDEGDIDPKSSILTLSLGAPRTINFKDLQSESVTDVLCKGRSLYQMTRHSQDFHKHGMRSEEDSDLADGIRYSLTFRAIHWSNFNSTALIGDSNFGPIKMGEGKGKLGGSTPGLRYWAPTIQAVDPLCCTSFKNVVLMVGTNDLKNRITDEKVREFYKDYKTKIALIRKYNSRCRIFVCPILPTKSHDINRRINIFNSLIANDLLQCSLKVVRVEGFIEFLDKRINLLGTNMSKNDDLHLNGRGISTLVRLIKQCIFRSRRHSVINSPKLFSNAVRGGPPHPV